MAWCLLCCPMFVGIDCLCLLQFSVQRKCLSQLTHPLSSDGIDNTLLRFVLLTYNANAGHRLRHWNILCRLGRYTLVQFLFSQNVIIILSIIAYIFFILDLFNFFFLLRQGITIQPWLAQNLLSRPVWPQAHRDPPDSRVLGLKVCTIASSSCVIYNLAEIES